MASFLHRLLRGAVLGMMLLIAGAANLICVAYDADDNDETPPVTVELSVVAPCKKSLHVPKTQSHSGICQEKPQTEARPSLTFESAPLLDQASPQLVVPLRT